MLGLLACALLLPVHAAAPPLGALSPASSQQLKAVQSILAVLRVDLGPSSPGSNVCKWPGIQCDAKQQVTGINLGAATKWGKGSRLPPAALLKQLPALKSLSIQAPELAGGLPSDYSTLTQLDTLVIRVTGRGVQSALPPTWSKMSKLRVLVVGGGVQGTLPPAWSGMQSLAVLDLAGNKNLTGGLPAPWGALQQLKQLNLSGTGLQGGIPDNWGGLQRFGTATPSAQPGFVDLTRTPGLVGCIPLSWTANPALIKPQVNLAGSRLTIKCSSPPAKPAPAPAKAPAPVGPGGSAAVGRVSDRAALLEVLASVGVGVPNAAEGSEYCAWDIITCDAQQRVVGIRWGYGLSDWMMPVNGSLPSAVMLRKLPALRSIGIKYTTPLPASTPARSLPEDWASLSGLEAIEVTGASLTGTLPDSYGALKRLQVRPLPAFQLAGGGGRGAAGHMCMFTGHCRMGCLSTLCSQYTISLPCIHSPVAQDSCLCTCLS